MRSMAVGVLCALAASGCGSDAGPEADRLRVVVADTPVEMLAGSTMLVQVLVLGPGAAEAVLSSPDLPAFATLAGSVLTLAPTRAFEGDHLITLVATAGASTVSAVLHVHVTRPNAPPQLVFVQMGDDDLTRSWNVCPGPRCTIGGLASAIAVVSDDDGDDVTVEVELAPADEPFAGVPTHSATVPSNASARVPLPGLAPGSAYRFVMRLRDALGASGVYPGWGSDSDWAGLPYGYPFVQGPCPADGPCACVPTGSLTCTADLDCCSGSCDIWAMRCL